jgi:transcriptional regulator with XRE-family HTH domain
MRMAHIGKAIKELREARGWTQQQLAKRARLTQGYVAKLESSDYAPDPALSVVLKLADALGVEIEELVRRRR